MKFENYHKLKMCMEDIRGIEDCLALYANRKEGFKYEIELNGYDFNDSILMAEIKTALSSYKYRIIKEIEEL